LFPFFGTVVVAGPQRIGMFVDVVAVDAVPLFCNWRLVMIRK
jgi:hypothetical protein